MIVMKFGGTSVANAEMIRSVAGIVKSQIKKRPLVVVSALGGVTDSLIGIANMALSGSVEGRLEEIVQRHYYAMTELGLEPRIISKEIKLLKESVREIKTVGELTPKSLDRIVSFGERFSARIIASYMSSIGIEAKAYDSYDIGLLTDSNFGDADVLPESYEIIGKTLGKSKVVQVITGFIGKDRYENITTLGRGGSDYTASIIGVAVGAKEIQIWKDVNGIMTADPKVVSDARSITVISYDEAAELALLGAKVLHPRAILPAIEHNIPVRVLNTFNPEHKGTLILKSTSVKSRVASIAYKKKIHIIKVSSSKKSDILELRERVLGVVASHGIPIEMMSLLDSNISFTIDGKHRTDALVSDLRKIANVGVKSDRAMVSLVGHDIVYIPDIHNMMLAALKGIDTEIVSSNDSGINKRIVVKGKHLYPAVKKLHEKFFGR